MKKVLSRARNVARTVRSELAAVGAATAAAAASVTAPAAPSPRPAGAPAEYTIDELARLAKTTVRNVRAYQDRGIIPPPERRGRAGIYNDDHLSRLRIVGQLLGRGYTLASIGELIAALEQGQNLAQLVGLENAVSSPWTDEMPTWYTLPDLVKLYGGNFDPRTLAKVAELEILQPEGARFRAPSAKLLQAGAELVKIGIPLSDMMDVIALLRDNVERAAEAMVQLIDHYIFEKYGEGIPKPEDAAYLGDLIWRLRPLVEMAVHAEVARAMERAATQHLGDRLERVLEQVQRTRGKMANARR